MEISANRIRCVALALALTLTTACTTAVKSEFSLHHFPKGKAFVERPQRPFEILGSVKAKADFSTLETDEPRRADQSICRNYYNKAVKDLVRLAKRHGGDAVIQVRSVTFLETGQSETYSTPECADDGGEGQVLVTGIVVKWKKMDSPKRRPVTPLTPSGNPLVQGEEVYPSIEAPTGPESDQLRMRQSAPRRSR